MALGANRLNILRTFVGRGLTVASSGVVLGVVATWLLHPVVRSLLSDAGLDTSSGPQNIVMNGAQAVVLAASSILAVTLAASWMPARRAALIEPMQALRTE
jgi:ABC-type lipoprotein release transport system permease subunit